jgi:hypothetical protein
MKRVLFEAIRVLALVGLLNWSGTELLRSSRAQEQQPPRSKPKQQQRPEETKLNEVVGAQKQLFEVRVVELESGLPIASAMVSAPLTGQNLRDSRHLADGEGRWMAPRPEPPPPLDWRIAAWKSGYVPLTYHFSAEELSDPALRSCTIALEKGESVEGIVQDKEGSPIAGATIRFEYLQLGARNGREKFTPLFLQPSAVTDGEGRWRIAMMPRRQSRSADDESYRLVVSHPAFMTIFVGGGGPLNPKKGLQSDVASLVLDRGMPLRAIVRGPSGAPVIGAKATLFRMGQDEEGERKTDAVGQCVWEHAAPGPNVLLVEAEGFAPEKIWLTVGLENGPVTVSLKAGRKIEGRVVRHDGRPVAGAEMNIWHWRTSSPVRGHLTYCSPDWMTKTDAEGRFTWSHAPEDQFALYIRPDPARRPEYSEVAGVGPEQAVVNVQLRQEQRLTIRGTVVDSETDRPIARFRVVPGVARSPGDGDVTRGNPGLTGIQWSDEEARIGTEGRFTFEHDLHGARLGMPRLIRIEAEGYETAVSPRFAVEDGEQEWAIALARGAGVQGMVLGPDGKPAVGADVLMVTPPAHLYFHNGRHDQGHGGHLGSGGVPLRTTGPDGRFWFAKPDRPSVIVAIGDAGLALLGPDDLANTSQVKLEPWGCAEGQVNVGGRH